MASFESNDRAIVDQQQQGSISINDVIDRDCEKNSAQAHSSFKPNAAWDQLNQNQRQKELGTDDRGMYTVERGDTMFTIAERSLRMQGVDKPGFKATQAEMDRIIDHNFATGIQCNPNKLAVGAKLAIPSLQVDLGAQPQEAADEQPAEQADLSSAPADGAPSVVQLADQVILDDQAVEAPKEPKFYGLNLGLFKLGVTSDGSLNIGANVGIARAEAKVGLNNRIDAGVGVDQFGARGGAGFGINKHGLHADAGGSANVARVIDASANAGANVGPRTGLFGNVGGKVGPAFADAGTGLELSSDGVNAHANGAGGIKKVIQGHADTRLGLNDDSQVGADVGVGLGPLDLSVGTDVTTKGNSAIRPGAHFDVTDKNEQARLELAAQVGPKLDARVGIGADHAYTDTGEKSGGDASLGLGQSGVGVSTTEWNNNQAKVKSFGVGKDY